MYNSDKEINGTCKRMSTIFNRLEKLVSSEIDTIHHNAIKAINLIKAEFNDNKYCTYSSYKYNNVCVFVNIVECDNNNITYTIGFNVDFEFDAMCKSIYVGRLLREYIDGKHTNETATDNNTKDTESDTNDTNKDTNTTDNTKENDRTTCYIKAYYDGKELTVPCNKYKCKQYAVEYIKALYENHVVEYETLFFIYYGKYVEIITIENVLNVPDLIEYNIENINDGLKCDSYKKVQECFERICSLIDDNHLIAIGFVSANKTRYYTITKSNCKGCYNFKIGNDNWIQKPAEIARFLYYHTFAHDVVFKHYGTI